MRAIVLEGRVVVVVAPAEEPVSLDDAKVHLAIGDTLDHDVRVEPLLAAARQHIEAVTGRALVTQTLDIYFDAVPCGRVLELPMPPLQSVTSVTTYDDANVGTVLSASEYLVDIASEPGRIVLNADASWPTGLRDANSLVVRAVAGYGSPVAVPQALKQAMRLLIGSLSEHREQVIVSQFAGQFLEVPFGVKQLVAPYQLRR